MESPNAAETECTLVGKREKIGKKYNEQLNEVR